MSPETSRPPAAAKMVPQQVGYAAKQLRLLVVLIGLIAASSPADVNAQIRRCDIDDWTRSLAIDDAEGTEQWQIVAAVYQADPDGYVSNAKNAGSSDEPDFWCRETLQRVFDQIALRLPTPQMVIEAGDDVAKTRGEAPLQRVVFLGMPPGITGGVVNPITPGLILAIADHRGRVLSFCIGVPDRERLAIMLNDAAAVQMELRAAGDHPDTTFGSPAWYANRTQYHDVRRSHFYDAAVENVQSGLSQFKIRPKDDPADGQNVNAILSQVDKDEIDFAADRIAPDQRDDPHRLAFIRRLAGSFSSDDPTALFYAAHHFIEPIFMQDFVTRFQVDASTFDAEMRTWQQHASARNPYVDAMAPFVEGQPLADLLPAMGAAIWRAPVVPPVDANLTVWQQWIAKPAKPAGRTVGPANVAASASNACVLAIDYRSCGWAAFDVDAAIATADRGETPVRIQTVDQLGVWLTQMPMRSIRVGELASLVASGDIPPVDLLRPTVLRFVVRHPRHDKPVLIRPSDSPIRMIKRLKPWLE